MLIISQLSFIRNSFSFGSIYLDKNKTGEGVSDKVILRETEYFSSTLRHELPSFLFNRI